MPTILTASSCSLPIHTAIVTACVLRQEVSCRLALFLMAPHFICRAEITLDTQNGGVLQRRQSPIEFVGIQESSGIAILVKGPKHLALEETNAF